MWAMYVIAKYGVTVHKTYRFYLSSKTCTCSYKNESLQLHEHTWTFPECGTVYKSDYLSSQ